MKNFYILAAFALFVATAGVAADIKPSKINGAGLQMLEEYRQGVLDLDNPALLSPASRGAAPMVKVIVQTSENIADSLALCGMSVEFIADNFYVVTMPVDEVEELSYSPNVQSLSFGNMAKPAMNLARISGAVNTCVTDFRLPHPFQGDGVIVGAFDTGFDPKHINFMNEDLTATRLTYYANYGTSTGAPIILTGQETLNGSTDNRSESHATHVLGIAAGSYNGAGFTYSGNNTGFYAGNPGNAGTDLGVIPYYGVAPHAEIAVSAGSLSNANILSGVRSMIDYAHDQGKPIVINLSLGSTSGPHDGTDTEVQALNALAREAVICISSGNEGDANIYAGKDITAADGGSFNVMLAAGFKGVVDCWSSTDVPFEVSVMLVNKSDGSVVAMAECKDGQLLTVNNSTPGFNSYVTGSLNLRPRLDSNNQRYEVRIDGTLNLTSSYSATHAFALKVSTAKAAKIDMYGNSDCSFYGFPLSEYVNPDNNGSINGMACGKNTISVGSYNTRQWWFTTQKTAYCYNGSSSGENSISSFSSYGTLLDGRNLPDFCAPGSAIISSYSADYVASQPNGLSQSLTATATKDNNTYYWGVMQGTSMSCPYAAGTIALWLEANPDLTSEQIKEIVSATATKPSVSTVAWGAGRLNALKGLQRVLSLYPAGISGVVVGEDNIDIRNSAGAVEVFAAGAGKIGVELYTVGGALAAKTVASGDTAVLSTEGLAKGVYVLRAVADGTRVATSKIAL